MSPLTLTDRRAIVARLHAAELDAGAIASALEISARTVRRDLRAGGLVPRPRGRPRRNPRDDVDPDPLAELLRGDGKLDATLDALAGALATDEERTARMRRRLEQAQAIEAGRDTTPQELLAMIKLDQMLGSLERSYELRALTRQPS